VLKTELGSSNSSCAGDLRRLEPPLVVRYHRPHLPVAGSRSILIKQLRSTRPRVNQTVHRLTKPSPAISQKHPCSSNITTIPFHLMKPLQSSPVFVV
jgi:hypothetical protein